MKCSASFGMKYGGMWPSSGAPVGTLACSVTVDTLSVKSVVLNRGHCGGFGSGPQRYSFGEQIHVEALGCHIIEAVINLADGYAWTFTFGE